MKLIDADLILDTCQFLVDRLDPSLLTWDMAVKLVADAPTMQVQPVVQCKDCKWKGNDEHCPVCNSCGRRELPKGYWFCADGERKEDAID